MPSARALLALAFLAAAAGSAAGLSVDDVAVRQMVDIAYRQQYDSAYARARELFGGGAADPAAPFWQAAFIQLLIYDSGDPALADSFFALSERTTALCRTRIRREPRDAEAHFYLGMTQLNRAQFLAWQQHASSAFKIMLGVPDELRAALARDSSLADAWFGLGMIEYLMAKSSKYTLGIGLLGSKKQAYQMVRRAVARGGAFRVPARFSLVYMLKEDGDYAGAVSTCRTMLMEYPGNRALLRILRDVYYKQGDYQQVVRMGPEIEANIAASYPKNLYGLSENWVVTGKAWFRMGQRDSARACFERVLALESRRGQVPWLSTYLREAREYSARLSRK